MRPKPVLTLAVAMWISIHLCALDASASQTSVTDVAKRVGITSQALTACGLHDHVELILNNIASEQSRVADLAGVDAAIDDAAADVEAISTTLRDRPADPQLTQELAQALSVLTDLRQQQRTIESELRVASVRDIDDSGAIRLQYWFDSIPYEVPDSFRVLRHTPEQWRRIEAAVRAERRSQQRDLELAPAHQILLNNVRADLNVEAARIRLQTYLADVQATFDAFSAGS